MNEVEPIRDKDKISDMKRVLKEQSERNYMLFVFGINIGMRISDILRLKVCDVMGNYIDVRERKTHKANRFIIPTGLKRELLVYTFDMDVEDYLFQSRIGYNKPITRQQAYNIIRQAGIRVGLKNLGTHTLRKTFGYHHYKQHKDVALLQDIFNHSSPSITLRYIGINLDCKEQSLKGFKL